ncbi:MAG TPA: GntR family transcriptional regulator [Draconibacterium sp.]|nr:GntR family transcriptional regulator [Draconibacterium sp.]
MSKLTFTIEKNSNVLKFQQLVDGILDSISRNELKEGDMLPSVNQIMKDCKLSRDTVFKAYAELKKRGVVESVPNRGYFVTRKITKVFLFLDTFKAYKEVLYHSILNYLPKNISVDLHFHHYNIDLFDKIITESVGRYTKYVVMNFDNKKVKSIIDKIPEKQLLIIDWKINGEGKSCVYQDFGEVVYNCFDENINVILKYKRFTLFYPDFTYHPYEVVQNFERFGKSRNINYRVITSYDEFDLQEGDLYFLVSDRTLARFLDQCSDKGYEPGREVGVISYNETPMKKYVKEGITVISTDFNLMGQKAAEFIVEGKKINYEVPTSLKLRSSL